MLFNFAAKCPHRKFNQFYLLAKIFAKRRFFRKTELKILCLTAIHSRLAKINTDLARGAFC